MVILYCLVLAYTEFMRRAFFFIFIILVFGFLVFLGRFILKGSGGVSGSTQKDFVVINPTSPGEVFPFVAPLDRVSERVTKKFFGTYVTPKSSPVQPERFSGYHTGVDFETFAEERGVDVVVHAICTGPLVMKRFAMGYGGIMVQRCGLDGKPVTVLYGHLRLSSITAAVGKEIKAGDSFAVLGAGYSHETDGERKHLHVGVHYGKVVDVHGYVSSSGELSAWSDVLGLIGD